MNNRRLPAIPLATTSLLLFFGLAGWAAHEGGPTLLFLLVPVVGLFAAIAVAIRGVRGSLLFWAILCLLGAAATVSMFVVAGIAGSSLPQ